MTGPNECLSLEEIMGVLEFRDNYDSEIEVLVLEDEYTPNYDKLGNYKMLCLLEILLVMKRPFL